MSTHLPADEVLLEQAIADKIVSLLNSVPIISSYVNVYKDERFPDSGAEDEEIITIADPVVPSKLLTSIITVGIPTIAEYPYTSDECTQLDFEYPIQFTFSVVDEWQSGAGFYYLNSSQFVKAVYLKARRTFKGNANRDLGYNNCVHNFLQQGRVGTIEDEDTGGWLHVIDWSLEVQCTGVLV